MPTYQETITVKTPGRGMINITDRIAASVMKAGVATGLCHLFLSHTSASLIICENADPAVQQDLETFFYDLVPDGDARFKHISEGPDDMVAHVRTILTQSTLVVPISKMHLNLGVWQGIFIWEHRLKSHDRKVIITIQG